MKTPITVAYGDGIGPEIMAAALRVLEAGGAELDIETIEIGEQVYKRGGNTGIEPGAWESLRRTKVFYKAPITTPQGGGYKSLNVTARKALGLYANVRPCIAYAPFVDTLHPGMNVVIIRENEEDLYAGIEHRQTDDVYQCLKLVTRPGTEKIVRYAFEYARSNGRRKVTCFMKDNIMKFTDGLFHSVFEEIGTEYPDIEKEVWIVDIGAAKLADQPGQFDVIVMPNLYGDILSDVAAQIAGSVGLAGSANIGDQCAMFEAIHGSAPRRAGQNVANPSGLLLAGVMMLAHIGQTDAAARVHHAWLKTLEDGIHTYDIFKEGVSVQQVGTAEFADAVIARMGQLPVRLPQVHYEAAAPITAAAKPVQKAEKQLVGVDVFLHWDGGSADDLGRLLEGYTAGPLQLQVITNRGVKVYPGGLPETFCTDHWRCRFMGGAAGHQHVAQLYSTLAAAGFDCIKTENLYTFDGQPGYSAVHG
ncbi:NADP-dependent isocitrate dehydrogenase [Ectobacillus ponti]|uniref:Isocitrate dehydrogenase [NADP] n=1 Tax=Ectobacillus ponti TaxID=2961894 RepID=A0AA41X2M9_9BACI|nr:NADP-dependent isocitrate dehydrogenase [Ectobacillus ponti]MCP8967791.1 NADP-dependent isocitrate dehydrogenase [Ectobacillus ponti]